MKGKDIAILIILIIIITAFILWDNGVFKKKSVETKEGEEEETGVLSLTAGSGLPRINTLGNESPDSPATVQTSTNVLATPKDNKKFDDFIHVTPTEVQKPLVNIGKVSRGNPVNYGKKHRTTNTLVLKKTKR